MKIKVNNKFKQIKIMIVEDDPLIRQLYGEVLAEKGFNVVALASDGAEAIELYHKLSIKPDLIILDFRMPKMDGIQVTEEIQSFNKEIDILMISGDPLFDKGAVINKGVNVMQKPVDINKLLQQIHTIGSHC